MCSNDNARIDGVAWKQTNLNTHINFPKKIEAGSSNNVALGSMDCANSNKFIINGYNISHDNAAARHATTPCDKALFPPLFSPALRH